MAVESPKVKEWFEITISIDPVAHEAAGAYLFEMGCEGLVFGDQHDPGVKAYMAAEHVSEEKLKALGRFLASLQEIFPEIPPPEFQVREVPGGDWSLYWRSFFGPDLVTPELLILPPWESLPSPFKGHVIKIDPGPAFGTGRHPTTRMCLKALEHVVPGGEWTMIDVGTGSGILAIYGKLLGAKRVVAVDTDPEAVRWARRNIQLNSLSHAIEVSFLPLEDCEGPFSVLAANLTLEIILDLFPLFPRIIRPGGKAILSGILSAQAEDLNDHLSRHQFEPCETLREDEWACIIAVNRGSAAGGKV